MIRVVLIAAMACMAASPALAQDTAPSDSGKAEVDVITITGQRSEGVTLEEYVMDFVQEIGDPISTNYGFARWEKGVCVSVQNIPVDAAQYIADRVSKVALDLGLRPGGPGCKPSIVIIFTTDGTALASYLVDRNPRVFRPFAGTGGTTQGGRALVDFARSDAPVRWWQITMVVDRAGNVAIVLPNSVTGPPIVMGANSHIKNSVRDELWATYIIVDTQRLGGANWRQLADYLAMVALTQVDPKASAAGYDSILNLFETASPAQGLTAWDATYLKALYDLDTRLVPRVQRDALANLIVRDQKQPTTNE